MYINRVHTQKTRVGSLVYWSTCGRFERVCNAHGNGRKDTSRERCIGCNWDCKDKRNVTCHAGPIPMANTPSVLCSDSVGLPLATLRTLGTVLHNLSWDTGDPFTSLSFLLYLLAPWCLILIIYCVYSSCSHLYTSMDHSSSGSSIDSSTIVSIT